MLFDKDFDWVEEEGGEAGGDGVGEEEAGEGEEGTAAPHRAAATGPQAHLRPSRALRLVPSRLISRVWGKMNSIPIPKRARGPIYRSYSWAFGVNLDEIRCVCRPAPLVPPPTYDSHIHAMHRVDSAARRACCLVSPVLHSCPFWWTSCHTDDCV